MSEGRVAPAERRIRAAVPGGFDAGQGLPA
jgi:hypothetical protein